MFQGGRSCKWITASARFRDEKDFHKAECQGSHSAPVAARFGDFLLTLFGMVVESKGIEKGFRSKFEDFEVLKLEMV